MNRFPGDDGGRILIIGPVQNDPDEEGLAGMGWFVPYLDSQLVRGELLWHVFPGLSKNQRPTRDHAIHARERLLKIPGAVRVDDWGLFIAAARLIACAKISGS